MDPNETLAKLRKAVGAFWTSENGSAAVADLADSIAEHADALDQWLSRGGFLPTPWTR